MLILKAIVSYNNIRIVVIVILEHVMTLSEWRLTCIPKFILVQCARATNAIYMQRCIWFCFLLLTLVRSKFFAMSLSVFLINILDSALYLVS